MCVYTYYLYIHISIYTSIFQCRCCCFLAPQTSSIQHASWKMQVYNVYVYPLKLTARPSKLMVGRQAFPFGLFHLFRCELSVSGRIIYDTLFHISTHQKRLPILYPTSLFLPLLIHIYIYIHYIYMEHVSLIYGYIDEPYGYPIHFA